MGRIKETFSAVFAKKGIPNPIIYAGSVTANLVLNPRQENISNKLIQLATAIANGNTNVSENQSIGKSIITATMAVIILFNI